jgi:hypothetical protein
MRQALRKQQAEATLQHPDTLAPLALSTLTAHPHYLALPSPTPPPPADLHAAPRQVPFLRAAKLTPAICIFLLRTRPHPPTPMRTIRYH